MVCQTSPTVAGAAPELLALLVERTGFPFHPLDEVKKKPEADEQKLGDGRGDCQQTKRSNPARGFP